MTTSQREKIQKIIELSKDNKPNSIKPLVDSIVSQKIHDILEKKKLEISKRL